MLPGPVPLPPEPCRHGRGISKNKRLKALRSTLSTRQAKRFNDCVRGSWPKIMQTFPEMGLWRELRQAIGSHETAAYGARQQAAMELDMILYVSYRC